MNENPPNNSPRLFPCHQFSFLSPSNKSVYVLARDLNLDISDSGSSTSASPDGITKSSFPGFMLIYNKTPSDTASIQKSIFEWFDSIFSKGNYMQNRDIFKSCLLSKQKCDQLFTEVLKKLPSSFSSDDEVELHLLSFWYDLERRTFYLYAVGMFDFFFFNGNVAGSPMAPLQNCSKPLLTHDLTNTSMASAVSQKSFHLVFENGLSNHGFFVYSGLPLDKSHPIHTNPILSRAFYRLKRDPRLENLPDIEQRILKSFSKDPDSGLLQAFYYILGVIPPVISPRTM